MWFQFGSTNNPGALDCNIAKALLHLPFSRTLINFSSRSSSTFISSGIFAIANNSAGVTSTRPPCFSSISSIRTFCVPPSGIAISLKSGLFAMSIFSILKSAFDALIWLLFSSLTANPGVDVMT